MSGFDAYGVGQSGGNSDRPKVDFNAMNEYVVKTAELDKGETLVGVITNIVDLGTQKLADSTYKLDEEDVQGGMSDEDFIKHLTEKYAGEMAQSDEDYGKITKFGKSYDSDSKSWLIMKYVKEKPRQAVAYSVDFPDIQLDKGQFFGDTSGKTLPLRLWSGGQYWNKFVGEKGKMLVQNPIPLKVTNIGDDENKVWSMNPKSALHKMAVAAKIIQHGEAFLPQDIDKLLGKSLQFEARIFFQQDKKDASKKYYNEKLKFASGLARGQESREVDEVHLIQFNQENSEDALKQVRGHIKNTIMNATNYNESAIKGQFEAIADSYKNSGNAAESTASSTKTLDLDDDLAF